MKYINKLKSGVSIDKSYIGTYLTLNPTNNDLGLSQTTDGESITFSLFIKVCKELVKIAQDTKPDANAYLILAQYGRSLTYNSTQWEKLCGNVPENFKAEASKKYGYFPKLNNLLLPNGERLELPHFWAALNGLLYGKHDICGWAGDLVTFAKDIKEGKATTFPSASFGTSDWIADADAYIIYQNYSSTDIIKGIEEYYNWKLREKERVNKFITDKNIMTRFTSCSDYSTFLLVLLMTEGVSLENVETASNIMEEYLNKYIDKD